MKNILKNKKLLILIVVIIFILVLIFVFTRKPAPKSAFTNVNSNGVASDLKSAILDLKPTNVKGTVTKKGKPMEGKILFDQKDFKVTNGSFDISLSQGAYPVSFIDPNGLSYSLDPSYIVVRVGKINLEFKIVY